MYSGYYREVKWYHYYNNFFNHFCKITYYHDLALQDNRLPERLIASKIRCLEIIVVTCAPRQISSSVSQNKVCYML
jgi:hypothetical protein